MFRFVLSVIALAGVVAAAQPSFADAVVSGECNRVHVATRAPEQPAPPAPSRSSSEDTTASGGLGKDVVPVGLGWG